MEASTVPRLAPAGGRGASSQKLLRLVSDDRLVALVRAGNRTAFETVYDRHHRSILSFCRHMLGSLDEAEDAVQHTFLSAYDDLRCSDKAIALRPWLFTIARNRCFSILRARREYPTGEMPDEPAIDGLAAEVQRRQDLRDLVADLGRLPDDQRAALVLAEMDALSHEQIASVLGVPRDKVKALVFQARESLVASRLARETSCEEIRAQLATVRGGALRRGNLRRHLHDCPGCRAYRKEIEHQRRRFAAILPVAPTIALKEGILAATVGGSAGISVTGGAVLATGSALKTVGAKTVVGAVVAAIGTAGTIVGIRNLPGTLTSPVREPAHRLTRGPAASPTITPLRRSVHVAGTTTTVDELLAQARLRARPTAPAAASRGARAGSRSSTDHARPHAAATHPQPAAPLRPAAAVPVPAAAAPPAPAPAAPAPSPAAPYLGASAYGHGHGHGGHGQDDGNGDGQGHGHRGHSGGDGSTTPAPSGAVGGGSTDGSGSAVSGGGPSPSGGGRGDGGGGGQSGGQDTGGAGGGQSGGQSGGGQGSGSTTPAPVQPAPPGGNQSAPTPSSGQQGQGGGDDATGGRGGSGGQGGATDGGRGADAG